MKVVSLFALVVLVVSCTQMKKSKSSEAKVNVNKLYKAAQAYHAETSVFPASAATTPSEGACCAAPGGKCAPDPKLWTDPSWHALKFSMDDPHYCVYTFESAGTGANATFTARANCDLDCDGTYSTFELVGSIGPNGTVTGGAVFVTDKELE